MPFSMFAFYSPYVKKVIDAVRETETLARTARVINNRYATFKVLVDVAGIEPATPCLQSRTIAYNSSVRFL